jgi:hypothetical protein
MTVLKVVLGLKTTIIMDNLDPRRPLRFTVHHHPVTNFHRGEVATTTASRLLEIILRILETLLPVAVVEAAA